MKRNTTILFAILAALLLPLLLNLFSNLIDWAFSTFPNETIRKVIQHFTMDQSTYLTILSIEATTLVAFSIYWMQKRSEKEKEIQAKNQARHALFSTLVASLKEIHALSRLDLYEEQDYHFIRISEKHFEAITDIEGLDEKDIILLHKILKELERLVEHEKEDEIGDIRLHVDKLISYIMIPPYTQYKYEVSEPIDFFEMMNENLLSILKKYDYVQEGKKKMQYFSQDGNKIIEYDKEGKAIVYNHIGEQVCHAFVDNKGIREGWAILYNQGIPLYKGKWKNYQKNGEGIEYFDDIGDHLYISREGIWNNGRLQDGIIRDVLVNNDGTFIEDFTIQINQQFYYNEHH
ncbi:hypothetical protein [Savagea faecisuis]|uniref:MORN repeat protein n=1 Tax=Savagea faecisuis TaxID=1274803 RepID=A0ABW3GUX6_9BACL